MELARGVAQAQLDLAQLVARARELGREPFERRDRALRDRDEAGRPRALLGGERLSGCGGTFGELGDVAETVALPAQPIFGVRLQPGGVLDERAELREPRLG